MATEIFLEPATIAALDAVVASGRFSSRDEAIRGALDLVDAYADPADTETIAMLDRRIADIDAGRSRSYSLDEVFDGLERRCLEDMKRGNQAA